MNIRNPVLAALISVLLLLTAFLSLHMVSASQAAAGERQELLPEMNVYKVSIPVVLGSDWLTSCYAPGMEGFQGRYPGPSQSQISVHHGANITVTTTADTINGDVSSVPNLILNPGPDGLALREAITATNNDPGQYIIRFSKSLT